MKKKKSFWSALLFICLLISMSALASAAWKTENGARYYYNSNNVKVTGLQTISGKKYLFKTNGQLVTNQVSSYKKKIYVSQANGLLLTKWGTFNGKTYYGTKSGYVKTGLQKKGSEYYYFNPKTGAMTKGWVTIGKNRYYFYSSGKAARNRITTLKKEKYYFNSSAKLQKGIHKVGKYYYGFGAKTGKMLKGAVKYGKYYYYFNTSNGRAITNAWKTIGGNKFYFNYQGRRQTGWLILGSRKYYLDPAKKGAMTTGKKTINGKTYNFGTKGYVTYNQSNNIVVRVNRKQCVVTIYDAGIPVKAMACSPGRSGCETPVGTFTVQDHLAWWVLDGPSWGQYCSHFLPNYLFHSVPMHTSSRNPYKVEANDYNCLGSPASGGCIRLSVADAKWIYYNVPIGSTVVISDSQPTPLGKPATVKMPKRSVGADPTDDFKNPGGYDVAIRN